MKGFAERRQSLVCVCLSTAAEGNYLQTRLKLIKLKACWNTAHISSPMTSEMYAGLSTMMCLLLELLLPSSQWRTLRYGAMSFPLDQPHSPIEWHLWSMLLLCCQSRPQSWSFPSHGQILAPGQLTLRSALNELLVRLLWCSHNALGYQLNSNSFAADSRSLTPLNWSQLHWILVCSQYYTKDIRTSCNSNITSPAELCKGWVKSPCNEHFPWRASIACTWLCFLPQQLCAVLRIIWCAGMVPFHHNGVFHLWYSRCLPDRAWLGQQLPSSS